MERNHTDIYWILMVEMIVQEDFEEGVDTSNEDVNARGISIQ